MSRRGGRQQPDPRRDQPFPTPSPHPDAGRGRGRGRARAPPSQQPPSSSSHSPAPVIGAPISPAPVVSAPISAPSPPPPSPVPVDALSSEVEQKLALRPAAPSSTKAIRFPDRPGFGRLGKKIQVRANHFQLQVAERDLHHYDVAITPEITSKKVTREVVSQLIKMYKESVLGNRLPVFDGRKNLFTAGPLPFSSKEFVVKLEDDRPKASSSSGSKKEKRERQFKVTIRFAAKVDLHHLFQFLGRQQLDCPQNTIQALDVALRATASEKYNVVGRSFFSPELGQTGPLGSGTEYWRGYYQSLRPTQMGLSLNIDVSARAFFEPIPVTEFVPKHFRNINFSRDQDRVKVKKALRGIRVDVFLGECKRSYKISGVSREPVKDLMFTLDDQKTKKSVAQYFTEKYKVTLKHANLPALQAGSDTKPIYLPMEVCVIAAGQRYTKRLNEEQVTALLRATCQRPQDRENYIKQIVKQHNFNNDKFVREFGISVKEDPTLLNARVLPPPRLKYHESGKEPRVDPWMGQWNMINKKMVDGGKVEHWSCLNFSSRLRPDLPSIFCDELRSMCTSKGMVFNPQPLVPIKTVNPLQIESALQNLHKQSITNLANMKQQGRLQLLIIILPDVKGSYGKIKKICETELGIVSQCCQPRQVQKLNKQYLENLALKINVKVGGRNTVLSDAFDRRIPHVSDKHTIIFGADVTHPQPGEDSSPSIAAVVASMDWPWVTKYKGTVSAQAHREEIIQDLFTTFEDPKRGLVQGGIIRELIRSFYIANGKRKPERIIFYRDGVSEGQFSQVLLYEMDAIRKAMSLMSVTRVNSVWNWTATNRRTQLSQINLWWIKIARFKQRGFKLHKGQTSGTKTAIKPNSYVPIMNAHFFLLKFILH
ncbi:protein argonaute 5 isoform X3 [Lotus japonicus]|uniref:protein argonaute 5 isoform X3 n=1 Tax=Lotus japonicus TaxID=34305 RepID=UPI0025878CDE|nr:protein argonaute 5 isoform X3 [Lotus japonicus]